MCPCLPLPSSDSPCFNVPSYAPPGLDLSDEIQRFCGSSLPTPRPVAQAARLGAGQRRPLAKDRRLVLEARLSVAAAPGVQCTSAQMAIWTGVIPGYERPRNVDGQRKTVRGSGLAKACVRGARSLRASWSQASLMQHLMHERHRNRPLSHGRRHALDVSPPHIPHRKHSRQTRLQ
jgi:hypothetical protein